MNHADIYVNAISLITPGADSPEHISELLQNGTMPALEKEWKAAPSLVAARALRRLSPQTLLAMAVAEQVQPALLNDAAWVFSSAYGEGETLKVILDALCTTDMSVRPSRFQNSVHNSASGQWTIAAQIRNSVTSICGGDATVGVGLLKSIMQAKLEERSVGFVTYDMPLPFPLETSHRLTMPAGAGLALSPKLTTQSFARLNVRFESREVTPASAAYCKTALTTGNPVFAILPLFERLCGVGTGPVAIEMNGSMKLCLEVNPL